MTWLGPFMLSAKTVPVDGSMSRTIHSGLWTIRTCHADRRDAPDGDRTEHHRGLDAGDHPLEAIPPARPGKPQGSGRAARGHRRPRIGRHDRLRPGRRGSTAEGQLVQGGEPKRRLAGLTEQRDTRAQLGRQRELSQHRTVGGRRGPYHHGRQDAARHLAGPAAVGAPGKGGRRRPRTGDPERAGAHRRRGTVVDPDAHGGRAGRRRACGQRDHAGLDALSDRDRAGILGTQARRRGGPGGPHGEGYDHQRRGRGQRHRQQREAAISGPSGQGNLREDSSDAAAGAGTGIPSL